MRASLTSPDRATLDCGPASLAVRDLLGAWAEIDWFAAGRADVTLAARELDRHQRLARAQLPDLFSDRPRVTVRHSSWTELDALCHAVRSSPAGWDWKFGALKPLAKGHSDAKGWSLREAPECPLFIHHGPHVFWALQTELPAAAPENARWYFNYAQVDLVAALEWQLAEASSDVSANPFVPLLRCYASGGLPFFLDRETVTLWALA